MKDIKKRLKMECVSYDEKKSSISIAWNEGDHQYKVKFLGLSARKVINLLLDVAEKTIPCKTKTLKTLDKDV